MSNELCEAVCNVQLCIYISLVTMDAMSELGVPSMARSSRILKTSCGFPSLVYLLPILLHTFFYVPYPSCWLLNYRQKVTWFTHNILLSIFIIATFMHDLTFKEYSIIINYRSMTCNFIVSNFPSWHNDIDRLCLDFLYSNIFSLFCLVYQFQT